MDIATFWNMIESTRETASGDIQKQTELLVEALSKESDENIIEFDRIMDTMMDKAYRGELWNACAFILCWCTDSDFMDFRAWLIAQGEHIFERAVANPDSLADIVEPEHRRDVVFERFAYIGTYAYNHKNGKEIPLVIGEGTALMGEMHDEDKAPQLFPALNHKLGSCDE